MKKISLLIFIAFGLTNAFCPPINGVQQIETSSGACITDCLSLDNKSRQDACIKNQVGKIDECGSYYCQINKNSSKCKMDEKLIPFCKKQKSQNKKSRKR
ncbi:MAG: hypothetical protein IKC23_05100 [Fibrobacter sp.]|nr:hypothetical protein [Fibrobacter sp.]